MTEQIISIVLPVVYLNDFSTKAIKKISYEINKYPQLVFVFVCSCTNIVNHVRKLLSGSEELINCSILNANNTSSDYLRGYAVRNTTTQYIYYQDCDDYVNYEILLRHSNIYKDDLVVCFNINKRIYDVAGNIKTISTVYCNKGGDVRKIENLPTNIVNKVIPRVQLTKVSFNNLPFAQDLAISYQLFSFVHHIFVNENVYLYEYYPSSSSKICHTKLGSLGRVHSMKKILMKQYIDRPFEKAFLHYRYDMILCPRYSFLGRIYIPKIDFRIFSIRYFGLSSVLKHLYHYISSYLIVGILIVRKCFSKFKNSNHIINEASSN